MKWLWVILIVFCILGFFWWLRRESRWDGRTRFTVISVGKNVVVESFDPAVGGGTRFSLPSDLEVETVGGRGKWRAGVLYKLVKKYGAKWAADSVSDYLGVGYTAERGGLGLVDRWHWWRWRQRLEWREVDIVREGLVREVVEVDGQEALVLAENWQQVARKWFLSGRIANENMSVRIINASGIDGAGNNAARMIDVAGIRVNEVETGTTREGGCVFELEPGEKGGVGVAWLASQLGCKLEKGDERVVILGKDYGKWWRGD